MKDCLSLSEQVNCGWYKHCRWDGVICDFRNQSDKPVVPIPKSAECPEPWYLWQILLTVFSCQILLVILLVVFSEGTQELYVKLKALGHSLTKKVKTGCEEIAQMCARYNNNCRARQRGYQSLECPPNNPGRVVFNRPDHVVVEMQPLIHRSIRNARGKEHVE